MHVYSQAPSPSASSAAPHGSGLARLLSGIARAWPLRVLARIFGDAAARNDMQRAVDELRSWDDHRLRDIGIDRSQIEAAVRGDLVSHHSDAADLRRELRRPYY